MTRRAAVSAHFHALVLDGVYVTERPGAVPTFHPAPLSLTAGLVFATWPSAVPDYGLESLENDLVDFLRKD